MNFAIAEKGAANTILKKFLPFWGFLFYLVVIVISTNSEPRTHEFVATVDSIAALERDKYEMVVFDAKGMITCAISKELFQAVSPGDMLEIRMSSHDFLRGQGGCEEVINE